MVGFLDQVPRSRKDTEVNCVDTAVADVATVLIGIVEKREGMFDMLEFPQSNLLG
jgi:hypothetical protein